MSVHNQDLTHSRSDHETERFSVTSMMKKRWMLLTFLLVATLGLVVGLSVHIAGQSKPIVTTTAVSTMSTTTKLTTTTAEGPKEKAVLLLKTWWVGQTSMVIALNGKLGLFCSH